MLLFFALGRSYFRIAAALAIAFGLLGLVLTVQTFRTSEPRLHRLFFLTTGIAAMMIPVSAVMHNLVYALCILFFGDRFWSDGSDEPFFFLLAIVVCPVLFMIGAVGSAILLIKGSATR
jgi:hypothetical protein